MMKQSKCALALLAMFALAPAYAAGDANQGARAFQAYGRALHQRRMQSVRRWFVAVTLLASALQAMAVNPGELLDPKDAFRLTAKALDKHTAEVEFRIAPGYYLYRDRFRFETASGKVIADAVLPSGKIKEDQFFGRTETYRDHVSIKVPLTDADLAKQRVKLKVVSQGCADAGVCYIPQEQWVEVKLGP